MGTALLRGARPGWLHSPWHLLSCHQPLGSPQLLALTTGLPKRRHGLPQPASGSSAQASALLSAPEPGTSPWSPTAPSLGCPLRVLCTEDTPCVEKRPPILTSPSLWTSAHRLIPHKVCLLNLSSTHPSSSHGARPHPCHLLLLASTSESSRTQENILPVLLGVGRGGVLRLRALRGPAGEEAG